MTAVYFSVVAMVELQLDDQRTGPGMNDRYFLFGSKRDEEEQQDGGGGGGGGYSRPGGEVDGEPQGPQVPALLGHLDLHLDVDLVHSHPDHLLT